MFPCSDTTETSCGLVIFSVSAGEWAGIVLGEHPKNSRQPGEPAQTTKMPSSEGLSYHLQVALTHSLGLAILMSMFHPAVCLFPPCSFALKDQTEGLKVLLHLQMIFPGSLEAGSEELLPKECQHGLAALTAADSWL